MYSMQALVPSGIIINPSGPSLPALDYLSVQKGVIVCE